MQFISEFRASWQSLLAAGVGLAAGYSIVNFITNLFTPQLVQEFDWSRSDVALVGSCAFLGVLTQPVAGRLADTFGIRRVATVGIVTAPLVYFLFSRMTGELWQFFVLTVLQVVIVGGTTSAVVYTKLIASSFQNARGMALAIAASSAPIVGALAAPVLSDIIQQHGWRVAYLAVSAFTAVAGLVAFALIPAARPYDPAFRTSSSRIAADYRSIVGQRAFIIIIVGMFLCNLHFTLQTQHLNVILDDNGLPPAIAALAVSVLAISVITGRLLCGVALDKFPAHIVTAIALGMPGIGLYILASGSSDSTLVYLAVMLLGLSLGAETDVLAYLVARYFPLQLFSTVLGLLLAGLALAVAGGSLLLSLTLKYYESYTVFLFLCSTCATVGGLFFLLLRREGAHDPVSQPPLILDASCEQGG